MEEGRCALCVVALKPFIVELCLIHQKKGFSDGIAFMTLLKTSDLL